MNTLDAIFARHCYRGAFKADPVPREHLRIMLEAGLSAPSGCNKQTTSLIAVDDPCVLRALQRENDPPVGVTAPAAICVFTRRIIAYGDKCYAVQDYAAAIENILLAATALGYASCWYEGHVTDSDTIGDRMARVLNVPQEYELVCFLPIGVPADAVRGPVKQPFEVRAFFNRFPDDI